MLRMVVTNTRFILFTAFAARMLIAILAMVHPDRSVLTDSDGYMALANNLVNHHVFSQEESLVPDMMRTPFYPLLLVLCGRSVAAVLLVQVMASVLSVWLVMRICRQVTADNRNAIAIAGWFMALDIPSVVFTGFVLTETIFTCTLLCFAWYLLRYRRELQWKFLLLSSFFLGISILCRPVALFIPVLVIPVLWFTWRTLFSLKKILVFLIPVGLLWGAWIVRNQVTFGSFFYTRVGTFNTAWFQAASVRAQSKQITIEDARWEIFDAAREKTDTLPAADPIQFYHYLGEISRQEIFSHPIIALRNACTAEINLFFRPSVGYLAQIAGIADIKHNRKLEEISTSYLLKTSNAIQVVFLFLLYLGISIQLFHFRLLRKSPELVFFLILLVYFMIPGTGPEMEARFRIPILPYLAILSAAGWQFRIGKNTTGSAKT